MSQDDVVIEKRWYMIHTYSGYEKKVKTDLEKRIESLNLVDRVFRVLVPEEETIELKKGKKKKVTRKLFPGYVMVEMNVKKEESLDGIGFKVDDEAWYVIRNTAGVTGFVGVGTEPSPLEPEEARSLLSKMGIHVEKKKEKINLSFSINDKVKIMQGAFAGSIGEVSSIDFEHSKAKVMIDLFGRMTPVEVDFDEVEKS